MPSESDVGSGIDGIAEVGGFAGCETEAVPRREGIEMRNGGRRNRRKPEEDAAGSMGAIEGIDFRGGEILGGVAHIVINSSTAPTAFSLFWCAHGALRTVGFSPYAILLPIGDPSIFLPLR